MLRRYFWIFIKIEKVLETILACRKNNFGNFKYVVENFHKSRKANLVEN